LWYGGDCVIEKKVSENGWTKKNDQEWAELGKVMEKME